MAPSSDNSPQDSIEQSKDTRELLQFLREENEANRQALRDDATATRGLITDTIKFVSYPLTIILAVGIFMGWRDVAAIKKQLTERGVREVDEDAQKQSETISERIDMIVNTQVHEKFTEPEIARTVETQVQSEVQKQLESEMPQITKLTDEALRRAVQQAQGPILAQSPYSATILRDAPESFSAVVGRPVTMKIALINIGHFDAADIEVYASLMIADKFKTPAERAKIFVQMAQKLDSMQQFGGQATLVEKSAKWGKPFGTNVVGDRLSFEDSAKLRSGAKTIYFVYHVLYSCPQAGGAGSRFYIGDWNQKSAMIDYDGLPRPTPHWEDLVTYQF